MPENDTKVNFLKEPLNKLVIKLIFFIAVLFVVCHYTQGYAIGAVALISIYCALTDKTGIALFGFVVTTLITLTNPVIIPKGPYYAAITRISMLAISGALVLGSVKRSGSEQIPLQYFAAYLVVALISSSQGYFPLISYFKILNFAAFGVGLYIGSRNINLCPDQILFTRASLLAISFVIIVGSLLSLPFPGIAYYTSFRSAVNTEGYEYVGEYLYDDTVSNLFTGITVHSQFLGPALAVLCGWIICDTLFVERRIRLLHFLLVLPTPLMIAMTRARVGLLTFCALIPMIVFYCLPRIKLPEVERRKFNSILVAFTFLLVGFAIVLQIRNNTIENLIRKTQEATEDDRTLFEAFSESRMKLIEVSLNDFHKNPLWGTGFQVSEDHPIQYQNGEISIFSAAIEKGILPLMVLGETGIVGSIVFVVSLSLFYYICRQKNYIATITLFTAFLVSNMAEATFFSPGGGGGFEWFYTAVGGFLIDMSLKNAGYVPVKKKKRQEKKVEIVKVGALALNPNRRTRVKI